MTDRPKTSVDLRWEGGQKFTSTDSYGHTLTVNAPRTGSLYEEEEETLLSKIARRCHQHPGEPAS